MYDPPLPTPPPPPPLSLYINIYIYPPSCPLPANTASCSTSSSRSLTYQWCPSHFPRGRMPSSSLKITPENFWYTEFGRHQSLGLGPSTLAVVVANREEPLPLPPVTWLLLLSGPAFREFGAKEGSEGGGGGVAFTSS